jgi:hypothetical protein
MIWQTNDLPTVIFINFSHFGKLKFKLVFNEGQADELRVLSIKNA